MALAVILAGKVYVMEIKPLPPGLVPYATNQGSELFQELLNSAEKWFQGVPWPEFEYIDGDTGEIATAATCKPDRSYHVEVSRTHATRELEYYVRPWWSLLLRRLERQGEKEIAESVEKAFDELEILAAKIDQNHNWVDVRFEIPIDEPYQGDVMERIGETDNWNNWTIAIFWETISNHQLELECRKNDESKADNKADNSKKSGESLPVNDKVTELARRVRKFGDKYGARIKIAREIANGDETEAKGLVRQLRRFPALLPKADSKSKADS